MENKVFRACKVRIYPNHTQKKRIIQTFGCCRFVWNYMLSRFTKAYERRKAFAPSREDMNYILTDLKQWYPWLKTADSTALTSEDDFLAKAYSGFFSQPEKGCPKFKSKHDYVQSYTSTSSSIKVLDDEHVFLPKLGSVRVRDGRKLTELPPIKAATVSRDSAGRYFVSLRYETFCPDVTIPAQGLRGIDLGIKNFVVDDRGHQTPNPNNLAKAQDKIAHAQRVLARRKKGSSNYQKAKLVLARQYVHVSDARHDFQHKEANRIVSENQAVFAESLSVKKLMHDNANAQAIADASWSNFLSLLSYKAEDRGIPFIQVSCWYPSSQKCCRCGCKNPEVKDLKIRNWTCPVCGSTHDRDINAARNIKSEGMRILYTSAYVSL